MAHFNNADLQLLLHQSNIINRSSFLINKEGNDVILYNLEKR